MYKLAWHWTRGQGSRLDAAEPLNYEFAMYTSEVDTASLFSYIAYNVYRYRVYAQNQCGQYANGREPGRTPGENGPTPRSFSERNRRPPGRGRLAALRVCLHVFP